MMIKKYEQAFITDQPYFLVDKKLGNKQRRVKVHSHNFYELVLVKENQLVHFVNGGKLLVQPHSLLLVGPAHSHCLGNLAEEKPVSFVNIAFTAELFSDCFAPFQKLLEPGWLMRDHIVSSLRGYEYDLLVERVRQVSDAADTDTQRKLLLMKAFLVDSLLILTRNMEQPRLPAWLVNACDVMKQQENFSAGLPRFVALSGKSQEHLTRTIKFHYQMTPTQYINECRLQRAAELLVKSDRTITGIAYEVGFRNYAHFQKLFSARYSVSPQRYRETNSNGIGRTARTE